LVPYVQEFEVIEYDEKSIDIINAFENVTSLNFYIDKFKDNYEKELNSLLITLPNLRTIKVPCMSILTL